MTTVASRRSVTIDCLVLAALALAFRVYYLWSSEPEILLRADASQYFRIALNLIQHGVYSTADPRDVAPLPDSYRGPGYPTLLALPLALFRDVESAYWCVLALQALLGAAVAGLAYLLARRWLRRALALSCGGLVALSPHLVTQGACALTEPVFGFLLVAAAYASARAFEADRAAGYLWAGALFGLAALFNGMIVLLPVFLAVVILIARGRRFAILFAVAALVLPGAWAIRDSSLKSAGAHSAGGRLFENVLIGLEPDYSRWYHDQADERGLAAHARVRAGLAQYGISKSDAYAGVIYRVTAQPGIYLPWFLRKPALLWTWSVGQGAGDIYVYPMKTSPFETNPLYRLVVSVYAGLNLPLLIGAFVAVIFLLGSWFVTDDMPQQNAYLICMAMFCYATALYTILAPDARYANPFRPFEFLLAMTCLDVVGGMVRKLRARERHPSTKLE